MEDGKQEIYLEWSHELLKDNKFAFNKLLSCLISMVHQTPDLKTAWWLAIVHNDLVTADFDEFKGEMGRVKNLCLP